MKNKNEENNINLATNINNLFSTLGESSLFSNKETTTKSINKNTSNVTKIYELVLNYSYVEDKNSKYRNSMEDYYNIVDSFNNDKMLFCLFDGHGGSDAVKYVKDRLPDLLLKYISSESVEDAIIKCFHKIDNELKLVDSDNVGTTATIILILKEDNKRTLYCANVGDTRCVIFSENDYIVLSEEHKCTNEKEIERITNANGKISNGRVKGQLAITRTLGDLSLKKCGVIATPDIKRHIIDNNDKYIVLATDGLWDVVTEREIINISKECDDSDYLNKILVKKAIDMGSKDNISCIVIKVN